MIYPSNVIEKICDQLFNIYQLVKGKHIFKGTIVNLSMRTINRERGLELEIILSESKRCVNA